MTRLAQGGIVDRSRPLRFRFNGKSYQGFAGDTLASALIANNVRIVARSFKYHRPRGILTCGSEEPNALVQLVSDGDQPNLRATQIELTEGLKAQSVNCWPSVNFDLAAINNVLSPLFPAGFYYKTFMARPWDFYSRFIRRVAGLGTLPKEKDLGHYERVFDYVDVLIIGAGPAGLSAATALAPSGLKIMIIDANPKPGGHLLFESITVDGKSGSRWATDVTAELNHRENIAWLRSSTATGYYDHNLVIVAEHEPEESWVRERLWHIRASRVLIATGAVERPLIFSNNDKPGIMLCAAVARYITRYAAVPGQRAVIYTNNSTVYAHIATLSKAGVKIEKIVDSRPKISKQEEDLAQAHSVPVLLGSQILDVKGWRAVSSVSVATPGGVINVSCDLVCHSGGWNPLVHLHSHAGGKPVFDEATATFVPGEPAQHEICIGGAKGVFSISQSIDDAADVAQTIVRDLSGQFAQPADNAVASGEIAYDIDVIWPDNELPGKAFVDFQNDVTTSDIALAVRENFQSIEHVKRYTTAGMAVDQGKIGNPNVIGLVSRELGKDQKNIGTTTFRPPFVPISFGVIGGSERGQLIIPARTTPITQWHIKHDAAMDEAGGNFRRPFYFPKAGETMSEAVIREALATRNDCAIYDGTPLGTFELHGPDVAELLNRIYTNRFDDLRMGQGRFGLMLREDGRLMDDGVTFRINNNQYLMSCGTGAAATVYAHIDRLLQTEWSDLKVYLVNVSAGWATICICGPLARTVLQQVDTDLAFDEDFKFLDIREGQLTGVPVRVARVSYTGELSFEINVARRHALNIWTTLLTAGRDYGITPIGSETSGVLRIEKGFVSPAIEGDNITNPFDAGMGWVVDMGKSDFIGKRSLERDLKLGGQRQQVVGLLPEDNKALVADGSALLPENNQGDRSGFQGHVTAACFSPTLGRAIALALLKDGRERYGERVLISGLQNRYMATVTEPVFYDPKGKRMRG